MPRIVIEFFGLLLASLLVGAMFGIWLGFNPSTLSAGAYVEQQQSAIRALNTAMPMLGGVCIVLTVVWAVLARADGRVCSLLVVAALCLLAAGLVTRFLNQPINAIVLTWDAQATPPNWTELRDAWWRWHTVRTFIGVSALSLLLLAALVPRK